MKSAYELAMERLESQSPTQKLSVAQKAEIAEIDSVTIAKVAEREVFLQGEAAKSRAKGDEAEARELETQLARDVRRIQDDAEEKKTRIREGK